MVTVATLLASPPDLDPWQAQLGPLVVGPGTAFDFSALDGIDELPSLRTSDVARPWAHGTWAGDDWSDGRTIEWTLEVEASGAALSAALAGLRAVMVPTRPGVLVPLWFNLPTWGGLTRWDVRIRNAKTAKDANWVRGQGATADAQVFAPDPVGYGPGVTASTTFADLAGGLEFDLFTDGTSDTDQLEFGAVGSAGTITLTNPGTADVYPLFEVAGPVVGGFQIVDTTTGNVLEYSGDIAAGSTVLIDAAEGTVMLDGSADRDTQLVQREWFPVPASSGTTVVFLPTASYTAATLRATWAPGWW